MESKHGSEAQNIIEIVMSSSVMASQPSLYVLTLPITGGWSKGLNMFMCLDPSAKQCAVLGAMEEE